MKREAGKWITGNTKLKIGARKTRASIHDTEEELALEKLSPVLNVAVHDGN
ncbi:MAG: hypothetical protein HEQ38_12730 [Gemmatimonas sp.]|nr:hypothetical protein [Gemmatimonas sp.]